MKEHIVSSLKFSRSCTDLIVKDFTEEQMVHQVAPTDNHALWTLGHLAATDEWMLSLVGASAGVPESYQELFGYGTTCESGAEKYPPLDEVRAHCANAREKLIEAVENADEATLSADISEKTGGFAKSFADAGMKEAWHEGWHTGQLSSIRRAMGLGPAFGKKDE